jgi:hypothetical protein
MVRWVQMPSASQPVPVVSIAPSSPPMALRLTALALILMLLQGVRGTGDPTVQSPINPLDSDEV